MPKQDNEILEDKPVKKGRRKKTEDVKEESVKRTIKEWAQGGEYPEGERYPALTKPELGVLYSRNQKNEDDLVSYEELDKMYESAYGRDLKHKV